MPKTDNPWDAYTFGELGAWVHLLAIRADTKVEPAERIADLEEAQKYLDMMQEKLWAARHD